MTKEPEITEPPEETRSRENLLMFFQISQKALQSIFDELCNHWKKRESSTIIESLEILRVHAFKRSGRTLRGLKRRLTDRRRSLLTRAGMLKEELRAKLDLLWEYLREGTLRPILKVMNVILGSLAGVFGFAEVLKEFKELIEVAVDSLGKDGELITLNLGSLPELQ